jgi:hypothetical protein
MRITGCTRTVCTERTWPWTPVGPACAGTMHRHISVTRTTRCCNCCALSITSPVAIHNSVGARPFQVSNGPSAKRSSHLTTASLVSTKSRSVSSPTAPLRNAAGVSAGPSGSSAAPNPPHGVMCEPRSVSSCTRRQRCAESLAGLTLSSPNAESKSGASQNSVEASPAPASARRPRRRRMREISGVSSIPSSLYLHPDCAG